MLRNAVQNSTSVVETMQRLGLTGVSGGMHAHISRRIKFFKIDTSHFITHNKGKILARRKNLLVINSGPYKTKSRYLRNAMLASGIEYRCSRCGISEWLGQKLRLHIEHKNGNNHDDRASNLEFLCPNCHSQTPTYAMIKGRKMW